tara:strand:+ start:1079 stop:1597 length:519 start_codon:yes stop_codon:yes gene_type:complete
MFRFFAVFMVLLVAMFVAELTPPVQKAVVVPWTSTLAAISAWLVSLFDPQVISYGKILQHAGTGVGVSIEAGCNGIEACIILTAGVLAYPAPWRMKIAGILIGFVAIQAVNVLRVITLFYLADWNQEWFEFAHLYLWQVLIMIDVLVVWLLWIRYVARNTSDIVEFDGAARA